jgi:hypothetical protein
MLRSCLFSVLLLALAASPALARNGICRGFNFQNDLSAVGLYEVTAPGRTRFVKGWSKGGESCPSLSSECRQRSFLIEGNKVVVNEIEGDFACANYVDSKGVNIANWIPLAALSQTVMQPRWEGRWSTYNDSAVITAQVTASGRLLLNGGATYDTGATVNTGAFTVDADPNAPELSFGYYADRQMSYEEAHAGPKRCAARIRQLGPYLAVIDNDACGGVNVSFTGLYTRQ